MSFNYHAATLCCFPRDNVITNISQETACMAALKTATSDGQTFTKWRSSVSSGQGGKCKKPR
jgi:hypothetical protein